MLTPLIVETDWLEKHLTSPDLVVLDTSWHPSTAQRNGRNEFLAKHIPGSLFFDIDEIRKKDNQIGPLLPSVTKFASRMKKMGVGDGQFIVVYDTLGIYSSPHVWWTFRAMGHREVAVLNGGLKKWEKENRPLEDGEHNPRSPRHFTPCLNRELVKTVEDISRASAHSSIQIINAEPSCRYPDTPIQPQKQEQQNFRSYNLFYQLLLNKDGTLKKNDELTTIFSEAEIDLNQSIVSTCESGITRSILVLALTLIGKTQAAVCDGKTAPGATEVIQSLKKNQTMKDDDRREQKTPLSHRVSSC